MTADTANIHYTCIMYARFVTLHAGSCVLRCIFKRNRLTLAT